VVGDDLEFSLLHTVHFDFIHIQRYFGSIGGLVVHLLAVLVFADQAADALDVDRGFHGAELEHLDDFGHELEGFPGLETLQHVHLVLAGHVFEFELVAVVGVHGGVLLGGFHHDLWVCVIDDEFDLVEVKLDDVPLGSEEHGGVLALVLALRDQAEVYVSVDLEDLAHLLRSLILYLGVLHYQLIYKQFLEIHAIIHETRGPCHSFVYRSQLVLR